MAASFGSATNLTSISIFFLAILILFLTNFSFSQSTYPTPTPWPPQFHSIMIYNTSGTNQIFDLWYDYPNGRNFNIIQNQLGELLYDLEWNNGTKFVYTLDANKKCKTVKVGFGILTPDWLHGANYLGQRRMDGFLCNVWEKVDFIWYYEDVVTKRPVHWAFYTGMEGHLMTFEVGAVLEDAKWQAPVYCFESGEQADDSSQLNSVVDNSGSSMDLVKRKMLIQEF
ncbi:hypothetical protein C5167_023922 [Papaver somniferum]|uniref:Transferase, transferring glycosyl groups n=1 Tax=Papaver somniferum TaxID=3469 RepID=A0A4Y7JNN0_PAPSO|nr:uncharacterized protein At4g14100-like [Papaver somniferum]RZC62166.1 hypothetical protein C5167_023922 [Papaver somniferum]